MKTLKSMRLHIAFFGRTNVGKSTLLNKITGQDVSIVSDIAGTTTDVVEKSMELLPIGPVNFLDTAGLDDRTELGTARIEKTMTVLDRTDIGVIVCDSNGIGDYEKGEICDVGRYIECDKDLVNKFSQILSSVDKDYNIYVGKIGTADYFCSDHEKGRQVHDEFGVECVEMEGAAIAQVCYLDKIPFIVIRGISDTVNGDNKIDFHTYLELASEQVALIIDKFLKDWR